ncbi:MAG: hypothetical protein ACO2OZ_04700 [Acidilobaceae archaeon]|jgi:hypothetical protein
MVKEILLGDNPFLGVSHLAQEKARIERNEVSRVEAKAEIVKAALEGGVTGFTFSTHSSNLELLKYMGRRHPEVLGKLNYYILIPYAHSYIRKANVIGTIGLAKAIIRDIVLKHPVDSITSAVTLNFSKVASLFIGMEANLYLKVLPRERVKAILLHEVLTELIVAYSLVELLEELKGYVERKLEVGFGLETRNIGQLRRFLEENGIRVDYIMTPMNPLGYQMAPSKEEAEEAIQELGDQGVKIITVNILASGAVSLEETCRYLEGYRDRVYAVAYGTTKPYRAKENAIILKKNLLAL